MTIESTFAFASRATCRALGDVVVWRPETAYEKEIRAVFGRGFDQVASGTVRVSSRRPEITIALSDLDDGEDPEEGFEVEIRGTRFMIASPPQHDVEAVSALLVLKKA